MVKIRKAERRRVRLRLALVGPSGSGKTWSALELATRIKKHFDGKIMLIETENGGIEDNSAAEKYADKFDFDIAELENYSVENYIEAMNAAIEGGYDILVIDSLSHAWAGKGGILEFADEAAKRMKTQNKYTAWREATPKHNELVEAMLRFPGHLIVTMRSKIEFVTEKNEQTGKMTVRKVGMQPIQREGLEYEFDIVCDMDMDHNLVVGKTRCSAIADHVFTKPADNFAKPVIAWIEGAAKDAAKTEGNNAVEVERKALAVKVQTWFKAVTDKKIATMDVKAHRENWLKKWFGSTDPKDINDAAVDTLAAALADLEEKVAADYRKQAEQIEEAYYSTVTGLDAEEIEAEKFRQRSLYLKTPLDAKPTGLLENASPNTLKKYIEALKKEQAA